MPFAPMHSPGKTTRSASRSASFKTVSLNSLRSLGRKGLHSLRSLSENFRLIPKPEVAGTDYGASRRGFLDAHTHSVYRHLIREEGVAHIGDVAPCVELCNLGGSFENDVKYGVKLLEMKWALEKCGISHRYVGGKLQVFQAQRDRELIEKASRDLTPYAGSEIPSTAGS